MKTQHTTGEWKLYSLMAFDENGDSCVIETDEQLIEEIRHMLRNTREYAEDNELSYPLAVCVDDGYNTPLATALILPGAGEGLANGYLISAAPDLLAALTDMLSGWRYIRQVHGDLPGVAWDRCEQAADAAIAKATAQ